MFLAEMNCYESITLTRERTGNKLKVRKQIKRKLRRRGRGKYDKGESGKSNLCRNDDYDTEFCIFQNNIQSAALPNLMSLEAIVNCLKSAVITLNVVNLYLYL